MDWLKISITTTSEGIESVTGRLYNLGVTGVEIEDRTSFDEFIQNHSSLWNSIDDNLRESFSIDPIVSVYLKDDATGREILKTIEKQYGRFKSLRSRC
jgi:ribosomal protein L11 methyltransferase